MASRTFIMVGNKAVTEHFSLNDLAGAAGRMDLLCRSLSTAFFLSHGMRRDVKVYLVLRGEPNPPRSLSFDGSELKYMSPDERNIGGIIRKALGRDDIRPYWTESTPGVHVSSMDLPDLLKDLSSPKGHYLVEDGEPMDSVEVGDDPVFLLGDHNGLVPEQEVLVEDWPRLSLGKRSYHTDHCITVLNHTLDKRGL